MPYFKNPFFVSVLNKMSQILTYLFFYRVIQNYFEKINCGRLVFQGIDIEPKFLFFFFDFPIISNEYNIFIIRDSMLIHFMIL